jgi:hypothetical protein
MNKDTLKAKFIVFFVVPLDLLFDDCWYDFHRALVDESGVAPVDTIPP